jgi:hypothetical protein
MLSIDHGPDWRCRSDGTSERGVPVLLLYSSKSLIDCIFDPVDAAVSAERFFKEALEQLDRLSQQQLTVISNLVKE